MGMDYGELSRGCWFCAMSNLVGNNCVWGESDLVGVD